MINDSVREELNPKIVTKSVVPEKREKASFMPNQLNQSLPVRKPQMQTVSSVTPPRSTIEKPIEKSVTREISVKHTAPTLVEFHNKNAAMPEWRLQLQNVVRQRQTRAVGQNQEQDSTPIAPTKVVTSGANALKVEIEPEHQAALHQNPTVNSALQRIQNARRQFLVEEKPEIVPAAVSVEPAAVPTPGKNYPFHIAPKVPEGLPLAPAEPKPASVNSPVKPRIAAPLKSEKKDFDTNKLPPLPTKVSSSFEKPSAISNEETEEAPKHEIKLVEPEEIIETEEIELEEIEDLAPFSMRFNAGLFDLIIGSFLSLVLLAPFMLIGGNWFSLPGLLAFCATCAVVMFIYMTTAIGLYGRTFGMRLFSLELIDIEGENYPTIHQAAVSSSVYILSLALGGLGFLTLPFNEEKRAVHDIISGTIVVKEAQPEV